MNITRGTMIGPYEVLAHIGAGGMGDVWRARDKRIGRDVAIKVLPEAYAPGDERLRRFEQEARAAGALNHPGLVTIFDVGTIESSPYIVMELLDGETLRDAIGDVRPVPLSLRKTIDYGIQIASALAVAHEKGIIHRDLKPENVVITSEGRVKILDFGLAKLAQEAHDDRDKTGKHLTSTGMVVGTPGYMSPEQVRAKPLDHRTDIFSLGAVLYEMLSGKRAFDRESAVETMTSILNDEPAPLASLIPNVPLALAAIVQHCMEKNPRERFQSARDLAFQLRLLPDFQNSVTDSLRALSGAAPAPMKRRLAYRAAVAAVAVLALAAAGFTIYRNRSAAPLGPRNFKQLTFAEGLAMLPALSPDGKMFAFVSAQAGNRDIYLQRVDGRIPSNLTADSPVADSEPAFSPDGSHIAFRSEREGGGIFEMGVAGESVRRITDIGHNPSWDPEGKRIVVSTAPIDLQPGIHPLRGDLWIVDTRTGVKRHLFVAAKRRQDPDGLQPSWSPHGHRIAFWGVGGTGERNIWTIDPDAKEPEKTLVQITHDTSINWNPVWSADGRYLYFGSNRDGTMNLWRIAMNEKTGEPTGAPESLALPASFTGDFAVSHDGQMVFASVTRLERLLALPFDPQTCKVGEARTLFGGTDHIASFAPSLDGKSMAFAAGMTQENLFRANMDGTRLRQLTSDSARSRGITWSADDTTIYFFSNREGTYQIWSVRADGSGLTRITDQHDSRGGSLYVTDVSPDGRTLGAQTDPQFGALVHLDRPPGQRVEVLDPTVSRAIRTPRWAPDGELLAGVSEPNDAVDSPIAVYSMRTRKLEFLTRGRALRWLPDSRHLVFLQGQDIAVVDIASRRVITAPLTVPRGVDLNNFRLSNDGTSIYVRQNVEQGDIWIASFEKPRGEG